MKKNYKITTGDIEGYEVEAESFKEAFKIAVESNPTAKLGLLYMIEEEGDSEERFGHTLKTLKEVGLTDQELDPVTGLPVSEVDDILGASVIE